MHLYLLDLMRTKDILSIRDGLEVVTIVDGLDVVISLFETLSIRVTDLFFISKIPFDHASDKHFQKKGRKKSFLFDDAMDARIL
jgi:hypothetical protein